MIIYKKISTWFKLIVYDCDKVDELIKTIKENHIDNLSDFYDYDIESFNLELEEFVRPEENDGESTIEIFDDNSNLIWCNEIKDYKNHLANRIKHRMEDEYRKYKVLLPDDWIEIAAHKIASDLINNK